MNFLLTLAGILLLSIALAGVVLGLFMAIQSWSRVPGLLFALWWIPTVAAASGIFIRDSATFTAGMLCFLAAGAALTIERGMFSANRSKYGIRKEKLHTRRSAERMRRANGEKREYRKAAS